MKKPVELNTVEARTEYHSIELTQVAQDGRNHFEVTRRSLISNEMESFRIGDVSELADFRNLITEMLDIQLDA